MRHCPFRLVCLFTVLALFWITSVMANNETISSVPGLLSSFAGSKILLIGILNSNLTIITKDAPQLVYDVPMAKCTNSKMDLYGLAPMELNSKWPALSNNPNFTSEVLFQEQPLSISIKQDNEKLVFAFDIGHRQSKMIIKTVELAINPSSATYQEYNITDDFLFTRARLVSTTEQNVFFDVALNPDKSHQLFKYVYQNSDGFKGTSSQYMCKQTDTNGTEMIVFTEVYDSAVCTNLDWDIMNGGFVDQNRFHLFSHDTVYIFEYTGAGADPVPLKAVKLSDYFMDASPSTTPTTVVTITSKLATVTTLIHRNSTRKAGLSTGTIIIIGIAGAVLAVVLVGITAACLCCKSKNAKPRPSAKATSISNMKCPIKHSRVQQKVIYKHCTSTIKILTMDSQVGHSEVADCTKSRALPVQESEARLAEAEAQKKKLSLRRRTSSGRHDSRPKVSAKRCSSSKQQPKLCSANQTEKVLSSKSSEHTKAKSSTVAPRHPMSLCGGVKGSNAFKGSNRKF